MKLNNVVYKTARQRFSVVALSLVMIFPTSVGAQVATGAVPVPSASPATAPQSVLVPGGTTVVVGLTEPISSATAHEGEQIAIVVKKQVDVGGWLIIPVGANGHATVTSVEHAAGNGSGGKLAMSIDWVYCSDGGKVQLSETNHAAETGDAKGAASTATLLSWIFLGPLGFFAHNFVRGRDVTIGTDKKFTVFVDHDVHIQATRRIASEQGFEH
jgi:hypothetical protein